VVGVVRNPSGQTVGGIVVGVECFDRAGGLLTDGFTNTKQLGPGESVPFEVDVGDTPCSTFLVAGSGFAR
jgi:hypothetical protein